MNTFFKKSEGAVIELQVVIIDRGESIQETKEKVPIVVVQRRDILRSGLRVVCRAVAGAQSSTTIIRNVSVTGHFYSTGRAKEREGDNERPLVREAQHLSGKGGMQMAP